MDLPEDEPDYPAGEPDELACEPDDPESERGERSGGLGGLFGGFGRAHFRPYSLNTKARRGKIGEKAKAKGWGIILRPYV